MEKVDTSGGKEKLNDPDTSIQVLVAGQAFLIIDSVNEKAGGYNCRFLLGDGIELPRTEFNAQGIETFITRHLEVFGHDEVVFQVLVSFYDLGLRETRITRKYVWNKTSEKLTLKKALEYALFYIV